MQKRPTQVDDQAGFGAGLIWLSVFGVAWVVVMGHKWTLYRVCWGLTMSKSDGVGAFSGG